MTLLITFELSGFEPEIPVCDAAMLDKSHHASHITRTINCSIYLTQAVFVIKCCPLFFLVGTT